MLHVYVRAIRTVGTMRFRLFLVLGVEVFGFFFGKVGKVPHYFGNGEY